MPKPADHDMGRYLQHVLRSWLAEQPDRDEASFARLAALSKATVNNLKNKGVGAGSKTVSGFARVLGRSVPQLHAEADAWAAGRPLALPGALRFCDVPGWREGEARLRQTPRGRSFSDDAWRLAATTANEKLPPVIDDFAMLRLVEFWHLALLDSDPPPVSERAPRLPTARAS
jgi:hypothetical protein